MAKARPKPHHAHHAPHGERAAAYDGRVAHSPKVKRSIADAMTIKNEDIFLVTLPDGNIPHAEMHGFGLYHNDCRYLRGYTFEMAGQQVPVLASAVRGGFTGICELSNPELTLPDGTSVTRQTIGVTWTRLLAGETLTLHDEFHLHNYGLGPVTLPISLTFDADFEDIFLVRGFSGLGNEKVRGTLHRPRWENGCLIFVYDGLDGIRRSIAVSFSHPLSACEGQRADFSLHLPPHSECALSVAVTLRESPSNEIAEPVRIPAREVESFQSRLHSGCEDWLNEHASIQSDSLLLNRILSRALHDLHTLRSIRRGRHFFAAGVPWYTTLFGRDSLISAYQMLAYDPAIAEDTLRLLASYQGQRIDPSRDEAPGKIPHELRVGELARSGAVPFAPYYGTVDATPLFLILLAEHARWTGSLALFHELESNVEAALGWMTHFGRLDDGGFLVYGEKAKHGLSNQGWKDSSDGIVNADGSLATPPIALVEVQGYAYRAKSLIADLYARAGNQTRADRLRQEAEALKARFNRAFWLDELSFYALALQAEGRPCAVISSNPGQALWGQIVTPERARRVAERLLQDDAFSGWGVRTLASTERRFNPSGYHVGTVWPHDNALIAAGMRHYGLDGAAMRIFEGLFEAATHFDIYRMPEVFSGYHREPFGEPVRYPVACHPQAWAAGALPYLLNELLGLQPDGFTRTLRIVRPMLPVFVRRLEIRGLRVCDARLDLVFERHDGRVAVAVENQPGDIVIARTD